MTIIIIINIIIIIIITISIRLNLIIIYNICGIHKLCKSSDRRKAWLRSIKSTGDEMEIYL